MSLLIQAVSELLPGVMFTCDGNNYDSIELTSSKCNEDFEIPSKSDIENKILEITKRNTNNLRSEEYPTPEEWIIALIQKDLDNQPEEWNALVKKRNQVRSKYPNIG